MQLAERIHNLANTLKLGFMNVNQRYGFAYSAALSGESVFL